MIELTFLLLFVLIKIKTLNAKIDNIIFKNELYFLNCIETEAATYF
jgi:hypothetical protein